MVLYKHIIVYKTYYIKHIILCPKYFVTPLLCAAAGRWHQFWHQVTASRLEKLPWYFLPDGVCGTTTAPGIESSAVE